MGVNRLTKDLFMITGKEDSPALNSLSEDFQGLSDDLSKMEQMSTPLTESELKEFNTMFSGDEIPMQTGEITPMSLLDLVPTKAGSMLGTKMLRFLNKSLGRTRSWFRGIGKEGFDDLKKHRAFRPAQADPNKVIPEGSFDLDKAGSFGDRTYVSPKFDAAKQYATGKGYPAYLAEFEDLHKIKSVKKKMGDRGKWSQAFKGDLPIEKSNARVIKYTGPDDKIGTTVADFRKPLVGKTPTPTTPLTNDNEPRGYNLKRKFSFLKE